MIGTLITKADIGHVVLDFLRAADGTDAVLEGVSVGGDDRDFCLAAIGAGEQFLAGLGTGGFREYLAIIPVVFTDPAVLDGNVLQIDRTDERPGHGIKFIGIVGAGLDRIRSDYRIIGITVKYPSVFLAGGALAVIEIDGAGSGDQRGGDRRLDLGICDFFSLFPIKDTFLKAVRGIEYQPAAVHDDLTARVDVRVAITAVCAVPLEFQRAVQIQRSVVDRCPAQILRGNETAGRDGQLIGVV